MTETSLQSDGSTLRVPELDAVLTRLASCDQGGRLMSQEIIEKGVKHVQKIDFSGNYPYFATILE